MDPEDSSQNGRCSSCGFLAKFDFHCSGPPPYVYEMPQTDRSLGLISAIRLEAAREITGFAPNGITTLKAFLHKNIWKKYKR